MKRMEYVFACGQILLLAGGGAAVFSYIADPAVRALFAGIFLAFCVLGAGSYFYFRGQFVTLSSQILSYAQQIMHGKPVREIWNKETLTSKVGMELEKMERVIAFRTAETKREKKELQEMISEIAHQIKTPLSNINMYCEMFSDNRTGAGQAEQFMDIMINQLGKVEFLLDVLVKASRLEAEMIHPEPSESKVLETLAVAVSHVIPKAEQKHIGISVDCCPSIQIVHDMKWTAEAVGNILDNAVKYTPEYGSIHISVHVGEMYTEIQVRDNGKGIEAAQVNDIFKRFYREKSVSKIEGLGLGLYLARKIIELQKGYISVRSAAGRGSCFFICLPNRIVR